MRRNYTRHLAFLALLLGITSAALVADAQQTQQEILKMPIGSIFEIQAISNLQDMDYTWILTYDQTFLETNRSPIFQTRFTRLGTYTLTAEATATNKDFLARREFLIQIRERTLEDNTLPPQSRANAILQFDPSLDSKERIILPRNKQVVQLTPIRRDVKLLALDTNTQRDGNGDGNLTNDDDTKDTLFRTGANSLALWFVSPAPKQSMRLGTLFTNGQTSFQEFDVVTEAYSIKQDTGAKKVQNPSQPEKKGESFPTAEQGELKIMVTEQANGSRQFFLRRPEQDIKTSLLYQWDFGDGQQSLINRPIHTYGAEGQYTILLTIRDVRTGQELESLSTEIVIQKGTTVVTNGDKDSEKDTKGSDKKGKGSFLGLIFKIFIILIISGILGAIGFFVVSKLKKSWSLQKTLEDAEKSIVGDTSVETADTEVDLPPMELKSEEVESTPEPQPVIDAEVVPETPPTQPPVVEDVPAPSKQTAPKTEEVPSWLQQGLDKTEDLEKDVGTPTVSAEEDVTVAPLPPEPPVPPAEPTPPPPMETPAEPTPPTPPLADLPTEEATPTTQAEAPAPNVGHTAMEPSAEQLTTEKSDTSSAPSWLQAGMDTAIAKGQTPTSPPPTELQDNAPATSPMEQSIPRTETSPSTPEQSTKEEAERERKRAKRKRYRDNKKAREETEKKPEPTPVEQKSDDEPIAIIRADSIEETQIPPTPEHHKEDEDTKNKSEQ